MNKVLYAAMLWLTLLPLLVSSCESDSYEKGTGRYSLMRADLGLLAVNGDLQAVAFTTDDGDAYELTSPVTTSWLTRPDTTYRVLMYYNKVEDTRAEAVGLSVVPTLVPVEHWRLGTQPVDPVGVESAWLSQGGRYLNLGLLVRSGRVDDEEGVHGIGVVQDTVLVHADQTRTARYRFLHDQGDTPEYYTNRRFVSILLPAQLDTVTLSVNTYDGPLERRFALP